ncbi:MAG: MetQ/NlpA family ABC transporter substrate-binding protein [Clostridiaceae bacterium]
MKKLTAVLTVALLGTSLLVGCGKEADNSKVITIGATSNPHAMILEEVKPILEKEGYELDIVEFDDYAIINKALDNSEIDANYFQHEPFLNEYNKSTGSDLVSVQKVHIEPMGIYSKKLKDVNDIENGAEVTIPADASNGSRALKLLEKVGLITLPDAEILTVQDIIDNPKELVITEVDAKQLTNTLQDVSLSVINSNFAMEAKLNPVEDSLFTEDADSPYANIIVVRKENKDDEKIKALTEAITSPEIKAYIEEEFGGSIIPVF